MPLPLNDLEWRIQFPIRILAHTKNLLFKRKLWITELPSSSPSPLDVSYYSFSHLQRMMRSEDVLEEEKAYRVKSFIFFVLLLTLLFSNWASSEQQLTTIYSYTLYTKEIQVWKWLNYLANINAKLQDPRSKDHSLPLHTFSDKNYWTWLWNITRLSRQFPRFPFHFCIQDIMIHDFNFMHFGC